MTCPRCNRPGIIWRSTCAGLAVEGCADCHRLAEYAAERAGDVERWAEVAA